MPCLSYAIAVHSDTYHSGAPYTALKFIKSLLRASHHIELIFFNFSGVNLCKKIPSASMEIVDIIDQWKNTIIEHELKARVCINAALQRGIYDQKEATYYGVTANLMECVVMEGLGCWVQAVNDADRFIIFGQS